MYYELSMLCTRRTVKWSKLNKCTVEWVCCGLCNLDNVASRKLLAVGWAHEHWIQWTQRPLVFIRKSTWNHFQRLHGDTYCAMWPVKLLPVNNMFSLSIFLSGDIDTLIWCKVLGMPRIRVILMFGLVVTGQHPELGITEATLEIMGAGKLSLKITLSSKQKGN